MKNRNALSESDPAPRPARRLRRCARCGLRELAVAAGPRRAGHTTRPCLANLQVPAGNKAFLVGHAVGTQNYSCLPAGVDAEGHPRFAWTLFTPQATLFGHNRKEVITHFFSPNPFEASPNPFADGTVRATWQHSKDTSTVWGKVVPGDSSHRPGFRRTGRHCLAAGYGGGSRRRTHRRRHADADDLHPAAEHAGGLAPSTGCASSTDVGNQAFVPYTADYFFYKKAKGNAVDDN